MDRTTDPTANDPEIQIEIPTRRGPEPITSAALHGVGYSASAEAQTEDVDTITSFEPIGEKSTCRDFLDWYLWPYKNILYCLKCTLYHVLNWFFMMKMFVFTTTYIPLDLGLMVVACIGLVLFYACFEYQMLMAWIDIAMCWYLVEDDQNMIKPKISYWSSPEVCDCPNRFKSVMTGAQSYKSMIYYLIFKPVVVWVTSSISVITLICEGGVLSLWIIVAAHPNWFKWTDNNVEKSLNLGQAFGILLGAILLLPFVLYIDVWLAKASKIVTYFFLTNVYSPRLEEETRLLAGQATSGQAGVTRDDLVEV